MRTLPDIRSILPDIERGRDLLARIARARDVPEPVAAWRSVPEEALDALSLADKAAFMEALLPLVRNGRKIERPALRRVYQLFAFMQMPEETRLSIMRALHGRLRLRPERMPQFDDLKVRRALLVEAAAMAGRSPSRESQAYIDQLAAHLGIKPEEERRWTAFFERLTDAENRVAAMLGKKGHLVRLDDRKLELFKKAVAAVGVPAAVLFPLGTVGLSAEGITTGLIALGGGFMLPASVAIVSGLSVAVALGVSTKKILDLVMPTTDADRFSVDAEQLNRSSIDIERILDEAARQHADQKKLEEARAKIAEIIHKIVPISDADRVKLAAALDHTNALGARYLEYIAHDRNRLELNNELGAEELRAMFDRDRRAIELSSANPTLTGKFGTDGSDAPGN